MSDWTLTLIHARIPSITCKGRCQASCGPIDASERERAYFETNTGKPFPEALKVLTSTDLACPYLNPAGRCDVYRFRPSICRLWGVVPEMPCPFGCVPQRMLSDREAREILMEVE